jgi:hypothetical protein
MYMTDIEPESDTPTSTINASVKTLLLVDRKSLRLVGDDDGARGENFKCRGVAFKPSFVGVLGGETRRLRLDRVSGVDDEEPVDADVKDRAGETSPLAMVPLAHTREFTKINEKLFLSACNNFNFVLVQYSVIPYPGR